LRQLSEADRERYARHLVLPLLGEQGQRKLLESKVLVVGTGGLGSAVSPYLAAVGVGTLGIVDFDRVELSNLQRQVVHSTPNVGKYKTESAAERLTALNPGINVVQHRVWLSAENAMDIVSGYDVVVDATDNFPARYLMNDACYFLGKPFVYGSIFQYDGQASVLIADGGPCYRCLFPEPPPPGVVLPGKVAGILGAIPGVIGTIQATETVKLLLGIGRGLLGKLLVFDALEMTFRNVTLRRDPGCALCGPNPTVTGFIDYEDFCGLGDKA